MHPDHRDYYRFTSRALVDKSINSLLGIIEGVVADSEITDAEVQFLREWAAHNEAYKKKAPICELYRTIEGVLEDGLIAHEEREDLLWLCRQLQSQNYYDTTTAHMQHLHGIMAGIVADSRILESELRALSQWIQDHEVLRGCWPYDEVGSVLAAVMRDGVIDRTEHAFLITLFSEFCAPEGTRRVEDPDECAVSGVRGLCAVCPQIVIPNRQFCFTGDSADFTREQFEATVTSLGGSVSHSVTKKLDYLVVGADGNPYWAYACYGRKVEAAVKYRKEGCRLLIVHENDFCDAVEDASQ